MVSESSSENTEVTIMHSCTGYMYSVISGTVVRGSNGSLPLWQHLGHYMIVRCLLLCCIHDGHHTVMGLVRVCSDYS